MYDCQMLKMVFSFNFSEILVLIWKCDDDNYCMLILKKDIIATYVKLLDIILNV